jgi:hypothetical protein
MLRLGQTPMTNVETDETDEADAADFFFWAAGKDRFG